MVLGSFASITAVGHLTDEGVDAQLGVTVTGEAGPLGLVGSSMVTKTPTTAVVAGTTARLEIEGDFYSPQPVRLLTPSGRELDRYEPEVRDHGFRYEAAEVARCLHHDALESPSCRTPRRCGSWRRWTRCAGRWGCATPASEASDLRGGLRRGAGRARGPRGGR